MYPPINVRLKVYALHYIELFEKKQQIAYKIYWLISRFFECIIGNGEHQEGKAHVDDNAKDEIG